MNILQQKQTIDFIFERLFREFSQDASDYSTIDFAQTVFNLEYDFIEWKEKEKLNKFLRSNKKAGKVVLEINNSSDYCLMVGFKSDIEDYKWLAKVFFGEELEEFE